MRRGIDGPYRQPADKKRTGWRVHYQWSDAGSVVRSSNVPGNATSPEQAQAETEQVNGHLPEFRVTLIEQTTITTKWVGVGGTGYIDEADPSNFTAGES